MVYTHIYLKRMETASIRTAMILMTCKYCILAEMGHCRKVDPLANEPRFIRLANGTQLTLHFDCKQCEMTISE